MILATPSLIFVLYTFTMSTRSAAIIVQHSALKMLLTFGVAISVGITYWLSPISRSVQGPLERFLAFMTGSFLGWFNPTVSIRGTTISIEGFTANIVPACTGLFTMTIYVAAVLAYPCTFKRKGQGILIGVLGILALNWVRINSLLLIGAYWNAVFDFAHLVIWQSLIVFFAAFLWLFWVQRFVHAK